MTITKASQVRSLCITAEHVAKLLPRMVQAKILKQAEADHLAKQIRAGVEVTLDVAMNMETGEKANARTTHAA